jgi:hypothetical protein
MARSDKAIVAKVPPFVHAKLDELVDALEAEDAGETSIVAALIVATTEASARKALRAYKAEAAAYRKAKRTQVTTNP